MSAFRGSVGGSLLVAVTLAGSLSAAAQAATPETDRPVAAASIPVRAPIVTRHEGTFNGMTLHYTATVSEMVVSDKAGAPGAKIVSTAYVVPGAESATRPVMFVFNGGPISPSVYLHMGAFGPMRVAVPDDLDADPAGFGLVDNPYTILDVADLVFFDPAGTGYSRVVDGKDPEDYFSVVADGQETAAFITAWLSANGRTSSPAYVFGESYGTMRAAETAKQLAEAGRSLAGVILLGQALNIVEFAQRPGNIISYVVSLPTLTALGLYHGKVQANGKSRKQLLDESSLFARTQYLDALFQGASLDPGERDRIARRLEALSGIPAAWYSAHDLRITKERYRTELLKDRHLILGRSDARYAAPVTKEGNAFDPSAVVGEAYVDAFSHYVRDVLKVRWTEEYRTRSPVAGLEDWDWGATSPFSDWPYMNLISTAMEKNPDFRIFVGNGIYDTSTTIGAAEYAVNQSGWPKDRTRLEYYVGGHMPYSIEDSLKKLTDDVRDFITPAR